MHGASFTIARGEAVGLVGESGSGKTLTCRAVLGVLPREVQVASGRVVFDDLRLDEFSHREWEGVRGRRIGAVFQDPTSFLNPSLSVGSQLVEVLRVKGGLGRAAARSRALALLDLMGIHHPEHVFDQVPAQLSGGMLQRVMIAIAVSCDPELVVADEATTALDVTTEREVIDLLRSLRQRSGSSLLMVSHDLAVVAELCDRIVVFYAGEIVESGPVEQIVSDPRHPYTQALLRVASLGDGAHRGARRHPGPAAARRRAARGLPLRRALPARARGLHRGPDPAAAAARRAGGPLRAGRGAACASTRWSHEPRPDGARGARAARPLRRRHGGRPRTTCCAAST